MYYCVTNSETKRYVFCKFEGVDNYKVSNYKVKDK